MFPSSVFLNPSQETPNTEAQEARVREITGVILTVVQNTVWDNPALTLDESRLIALQVITQILSTITAETQELVHQHTRRLSFIASMLVADVLNLHSVAADIQPLEEEAEA